MYGVIAMLVLGAVIFILYASIASMWVAQSKRKPYISAENFVALLLLYFTMMLGFGLIYAWMQINGYNVFTKNIEEETNRFGHILLDGLYLSATTLLSVGYGDIVPVGIGKWIAVVEALLGYIMPATFVTRFVIDGNKK
jgi:potassium channel LctB